MGDLKRHAAMLVPTGTDFTVYGDDQSGVMLFCWGCQDWRPREWPGGVSLDELNKAAATHYWEVHG